MNIIEQVTENIIKEARIKILEENNIKKVGDKWRIVSGKSGELWKAHYDTKEDAQAGLRAYFANENKNKTDKQKVNEVEELARGYYSVNVNDPREIVNLTNIVKNLRRGQTITFNNGGNKFAVKLTYNGVNYISPEAKIQNNIPENVAKLLFRSLKGGVYEGITKKELAKRIDEDIKKVQSLIEKATSKNKKVLKEYIGIEDSNIRQEDVTSPPSPGAGDSILNREIQKIDSSSPANFIDTIRTHTLNALSKLSSSGKAQTPEFKTLTDIFNACQKYEAEKVKNADLSVSKSPV